MTSPPAAAELTDLVGMSTAVIRGVVPVAELTDFFDRSFTTLATMTSSQDVVEAPRAVDARPGLRSGELVLGGLHHGAVA
jgi:hypothetical protein